MTIALWILNAALAVVFLGAGVTKLMRPKDQLKAMGFAWVDDYSDQAVKGIGGLELLGAIGLILPLLLGIAPILTPIAALGLMMVMGGAVARHRKRQETFVPPLVLGLLSLVSAVLGFIVVLG